MPIPFRSFALCLAVAQLSLPDMVQAEPNEPLIAELIRTGNAQAAYQELISSDPQPEDELFFRALIVQNLRRYDETVTLLNQVLAIDPDHLNARRELASTLFVQGRYSEAERIFKDLSEIDDNPEMEFVYEQFLTEISARKPYSISGSFSILPSSNINRGTENLIYSSEIGDFILGPESKAESGIGVEASVAGTYRLPADEISRNNLTWALNGIAYEESNYNALTASLRFSHSRLLNDRTLLNVGAHWRHSWKEDDSDSRAFGVNASLKRQLDAKNSLSFAGQYQRIEYLYQPHNTGPYGSLTLGYTHQKSSNLVFDVALEASRRKPAVDHASYTGWEITGGVKKGWSNGYITGLDLDAGFRGYDDIFPLAGEARKDKYYRAAVSVQNPNWQITGLSPKITCSFFENDSNIEFYQYDVSECSIVLSRGF